MRNIHSIAEVPRQRFIQWGIVLPFAMLAGLAVGAAMWPQAQAQASEPTPSATASGIPSSSVSADSRFPTAPALDGTTWKQVDATWDLETVAYSGGGPLNRPLGDLAAYLTPPGGERQLAFYSEGAHPADLRAIGWDPETMLVLLASDSTRNFVVGDLHSGALVELGTPGIDPEHIREIRGLGRASDGLTYVVLRVADAGDGSTLYLARWGGDGWEGAVLHSPYSDVSVLSGDTAIVTRGAGVASLDVVHLDKSAPFENARNCEFRTWATATEFTMGCDIEGTDFAGDKSIGSYKSGSVATHAAMVDIGSSSSSPYRLDGHYAEIQIGTPIVLADSDSDAPGTIGIATADGYHDVGAGELERATVSVTLAADTRWLIADASHVPIVVDAARGTMTNLREDFQGTTLAFAFIPGDRS